MYAQNQLQATGNAQNLKIKLNAPALYELYPGLSGRAYGDLSVQSQPRLKATANIAVDNFAFNNLVSVKNCVYRVNYQLPKQLQLSSQQSLIIYVVVAV